MRGRVAAGLCGVVVALCGAPALACFDGSTAQIGRVLVQDFDDTFDLERAAHDALWLARIEALLPDGATLTAKIGIATITFAADSEDKITWQHLGGGLEPLFKRVARELKVPAFRRVLALAVAAPPLWTVQAGTFTTHAQAWERAERIDRGADCDQGFLDAGGIVGPAALIEPLATEDGTLYRVTVGVYASRVAALDAQRCLANVPTRGEDQEVAIKSFVRPITTPSSVE